LKDEWNLKERSSDDEEDLDAKLGKIFFDH
jgi:hypothetical protein